MLKQYKILVNEGKGSENVLVTVPAGAGARGNPTRITAKVDTRYELQDDLKGKGLAPDQVRGKRVGKNLYLMFEDNGKPDVIIEGYYDPINQSQVPTIVGKAENGSFYEYIPHDPELSSMSTTLKDGYTPAMLSLGGGPIAGGAFELAGLPLVAAAAGGGLGGLGWLAAGLGAAALGGGGGGGGSGGGTPDTTPPNGGNKPVVVIEADNATDNKYINKAEFEAVGKPAKLKVYASFDNVNKTVTTDDFVVFTVNGVAQQPRKLTATEITDGKAYIDVDTPAEGKKVTVTAYLQDATLNKTEVGSDETTLDTQAPNTNPNNPNVAVAPTIHIDNDTNKVGGGLDDDGDTYVNAIEANRYPNVYQVTASFTSANVVLGDKVTFNAKEFIGTSATGTVRESITRALTAAEISQGYATATFAAPKEGNKLEVTAALSDAASNTGPISNVDSAILDTTLPGAGAVGSKLSAASDGTSTDGEGTVGIQTLTVTEPTEAGVTIETIKLKDTGGGYQDVTKTNGQWNTTSLPVGKYTPEITLVDPARNTTVAYGTPFIITNVIATDDFASVAETGTVTVTELKKTSILDNDSDEYTKSSTSLLVTKIGLGATTPTLDVTGTVDTHVVGQYGDLYINSKGVFTYTAAAARLTSTQHDIFTYSVVGPEGDAIIKTATLDITVNGVDQAAIAKMVDVTGAVISSGNQVGAGVNSNPATANPTSRIKITDNDLGQSYLLKSPNVTFDNLDDPNTPNILENQADYVGGFQGTFTLTLEAPSANDPSSHFYNWKYVQKSGTSVPASNVTVHDLLTVTSVDGQTSQTLDAYYANENIDTNQSQYFYTATTKGLIATGWSTATVHAGLIDTLILKGGDLILNLTAASSTHVTEMERIDLTGSGNNTVKIDFAALTGMNSNQHQLYIIGDSGDKVQLVGTSTAWGVGSTATHLGYTTYTHNQDELIIQNTINSITFV